MHQQQSGWVRLVTKMPWRLQKTKLGEAASKVTATRPANEIAVGDFGFEIYLWECYSEIKAHLHFPFLHSLWDAVLLVELVRPVFLITIFFWELQAARETGALQAAKNKLEKQVEELTWRLQLEKRMRVSLFLYCLLVFQIQTLLFSISL